MIVSFDEYNRLFEAESQNLIKLKDAINNKFVCVIDYRGEKGSVENGIRYIKPLVLGNNAHGTILRAWMIKGVSKTGRIDPSLVPGYRLYRLDRIFTIETTAEVFEEPPKGYHVDSNGNPKDLKMVEIIAAATFNKKK